MVFGLSAMGTVMDDDAAGAERLKHTMDDTGQGRSR